MSMLEHALEYAAKGRAVFPCHTIQGGRCTCGVTDCSSPGKHPRTTNGHNEATTDAATITKWWTKWTNANIGFAVPADVVVLDVDIKHDIGKYGDDSLDEWEREHGKLPDTVLSLTGGGGKQYFFKTDKSVSCTTGLLPDIDVKSAGGYVILPPSKHISGRSYEWEASSDPADIEMLPLPEALYNLMMTTKTTKTAGAEFTETIGEGTRNDTLFKAASSLRSKGLSESEIFAAISVMNKERCKPPLPDEEVKKIAESTAKYERGEIPGSSDPPPPSDNDAPPESNKEKAEEKPKQTQAEILLGLVEQNGAEFFADEIADLYAAIPVDAGRSDGGHTEVLPLDGGDFRLWLQGLYFSRTGKPVSGDALAQAVGVLCAKARFGGGKPKKLSVRVAEHGGAFWYDLTNSDWQAVKVTPEGWGFADRPPVIFKRYRHQTAQIRPVTPSGRGGVEKILDYVNLKDNTVLFLCWLVSCFVPDIPHIMPIFYGEKGAAKSTACEILKSLIDPSALSTLTLQNDLRTLAVNLQQHHFLPFDNVSYIGEETSDILCRAITGSGIQQRKLHTNGDDHIFQFRRCLSINGINCAATRADLLDRAILVELERISKDKRRELCEVMQNFETDRAAILGGIFGTLSEAMKIYPTVKLNVLPRMADFTRWGYAIGEALGGYGKAFLAEYAINRGTQNQEAINSDPVATLVVEFMRGRDEWNGSPSNLYSELTALALTHNISTRSKSFPPDPARLSKRLNGIKSNLEGAGIGFEKDRSGNGRHIQLTSKTSEQETAS